MFSLAIAQTLEHFTKLPKRISTRLPNPRLPNTIIADSILPTNPILPTFVKDYKISSYYFLFKKKILMMCTYFIESSNFSRNFI